MRAVPRRGVALRKFREVFPGVVVIVAILIYLEQTGDILIGFFTIRCCIRIKQIAQRSLSQLPLTVSSVIVRPRLVRSFVESALAAFTPASSYSA